VPAELLLADGVGDAALEFPAAREGGAPLELPAELDLATELGLAVVNLPPE
jgi:hypothetical protein